MRIVILGGDARMPHAASALREKGHEVTVTAHEEAPLSPEALSHAEAAVLPLPLSRDGVHLFAPLSPLAVPLDALFPMLPEGIPLLLGREEDLPPGGIPGHPLLFYGTQEEFLLRNSLLTAEGAIALLCGRLSTALSDTPCMILGSGRLARALLDLLRGLHVPVTVVARRCDPLPGGVRPIPLGALPAEISHYPVILNTVPVRLLDPPLLSRAREGTILLDLSSLPPPTPAEAARTPALTMLTAPSLPGRYAPVSAGRAVADAVTALLPPP